MAVVKKSIKKDGKNYKVSKNIKLKELQCNDGTDTVLYDTTTVSYIQSGRDYFKKPVYISSAYRTASYNKKIGGAVGSLHVIGKAIDFKYNKIDPICACQFLQLRGAKGILYYDNNTNGNFTHCDSRANKTYLIYLKTGTETISTFLPTLKYKSTNSLFVKALELRLKAKGYWNGKITGGTFSAALRNAVKRFQKAKGLKEDGIVGKNTWKALYK